MKLLNFCFVLSILCGVLQLCHGTSLNCQFKNLKFDMAQYYTCEVTPFDNTNNNTLITGYSGNHLTDKYDSNVEGIWFRTTNTKFIPGNLGFLFNLTSFVMTDTQLDEIKSKDFDNMQELNELELVRNKLRSVPIDAFTKLTKLKILNLSNNQIEEIKNGIFENNLELGYIYIWRNRIKFLGTTSFDGLQLNIVELGGNICINKKYTGGSTKIQLKNDINSQCKSPCEVFPIPRTQKVIELSHELTLNCEFKYEEYVVNIFYSCKVTTLNINNNDTIITGHSGVHSLFKYDTDVRAIHIHDTNTKFIPENLGLVFSLTSLVIEKTQLVEIKTKDFIGMRNLEELNLSQNKLTSVPIGVFSTLTRLKSLNLGENEIEEIPNGVFANNLQLNDISLYMNKIKFLGSSLFQGPLKLNRVELNYNICIDKTYEGGSGIFQLKNDIRTQCKIPNEITKITTQNPAATDL